MKTTIHEKSAKWILKLKPIISLLPIHANKSALKKITLNDDQWKINTFGQPYVLVLGVTFSRKMFYFGNRGCRLTKKEIFC